MKDERFQNDRIENLLRQAHLPKASPELKQRITAEAGKAWKQTSGEVSWQIPLKRLVASAAAAVLIICLADYSSDRVIDKWRSGKAFIVELSPGELETLPELPYDPFAMRLATMGRKPFAIEASALRDHLDAVHRIIDESQPDETSISPDRSGGSSRLIPDKLGSGSYS